MSIMLVFSIGLHMVSLAEQRLLKVFNFLIYLRKIKSYYYNIITHDIASIYICISRMAVISECLPMGRRPEVIYGFREEDVIFYIFLILDRIKSVFFFQFLCSLSFVPSAAAALVCLQSTHCIARRREQYTNGV